MSRLGLTALVLLAWTALPRVATAQVPAQLALERGDFDGDGRTDSVRLGLDGGIRVELGGATLEEPLGGGFVPKRGTITSAHGPGLRGTVVVVEGFASRRGARGYAHVYHRAADRRGTLARIWQGSIGPQGSDAEWAQQLAVTGKALLLYETRPELVGCATGKPLRLSVRAFDFAQQRFRPVRRKPHAPAGATTLVATTTAPANAPALGPSALVRATGATSQRGAGPHDLGAPTAIDDGNPTSAWIDGKSGPGIGETILFRQWQPTEAITTLAFLPGHGASSAELRRFGRLRRFAVRLYGDGQRASYLIDVPHDPTDPNAWQWVALPKPIAATCVEVEVLATYRGSAARGDRDDLAIAEMHLLTPLELGSNLDGALAKRVADGGAGSNLASAALRRRGRSGTDAVVALLAATKSRAAYQRLVDALIHIGDPGAAAAIASAVVRPGVSPSDRDSELDALASYGAAGAAALAELLASAKASDDVKLAALERYERMAEATSTTYAALLGHGSRELRRRLASALARTSAADPTTLLTLPTQRADAASEADLWRAIGELATHLGAVDRARIAAALSQRLTEVDDYERRYRILAALAALAPNADALTRWWTAAEADHGPHTTALRRVAISAAQGNESTLALRLHAMSDSDPEVRARAIASLSTSEIDGATKVLVDRLHTDPWPMVRAKTAALLAQGCAGPLLREALLAAARTDDDDGVQQASILALLRCAPRESAAAIVALAGDSKQSIAVRSYAVLQVGSGGHRDQVPALIDLLARSRRQAFDSEAARTLAADTATALGRLADTRARDPLLRATEDEAYPSIQAAAAAALGSMCDGRVAGRLRSLTTSPQRTVALAAQASLRRCRAR